MRLELQQQMEEHKFAKQLEKKDDLVYFEFIRSKKEEQEREQKEKKEVLKKMLEEQRIVREKQIEEHARAKHLADREKRKDAEKLKS